MSEPKAHLGILEILRLLPHRYPFLLIDRVLDYIAGERITALKNVTINEPFFQGHFPVEPVMPGVLIIEGMAQAAAVLAFLTDQEKVGENLVYFTGIDKARFRRKVVPGDQIVYDVVITRRKGKVIKMECKALVEGAVAAEAQLMATFS
ncbi:MAG: 3-hydroxyacyl-ACP dehydratase FabZ [Proteobacteria bacterium]|nr:3-hydroxyacyl-ACP dehydratase FabZ [Pseudomonadota bacterium]MBU1640320.1 3-hydroxyacyl-ACP dehydratase FabZ [Pseudomonadota bacterium]